MIQYGQNITSPNDKLQRISVESVHRAISRPKPESIALIRQLRIVRQIDPQQYAALKKRLPYIVCASFNPPYRRGENFASVERFIIDLDHLGDNEIDIPSLRKKLEADERTELLFLSPSGDGLKVMLRLGKSCQDKGLFTIFYRTFLPQYAKQYNIEQVIDSRTNDVTRACFLSHDPKAYYNPNATPVDLATFVDTENTLTIFNSTTKESHHGDAVTASQPVSDNTIENIKHMLSLASKRTARTKSEAYVPPQLNDIMDGLKEYIISSGTIVQEVMNIQYGKKIRTSIAGKLAETNLFYGKRGFSVVISPRTGTNADANQLAAELIQSYLDINT